MQRNKRQFMQGKIIKGVGGFYYIHLHSCNQTNKTDNDALYECKAKGIFRNKKIKPAVGDDVEIDIISEEEHTGNIVEILERKNLLIRPAVANVDQAMIIFAIKEPDPNFNLLDRFLIMMEQQSVETMICFNKIDLVDSKTIDKSVSAYKKSGHKVFVTSTYDNKGIDELINRLKGKTTVLAGPSGVGKSSLLNSVGEDVCVKTGEISEKIKRGKHTTRHSELMHIGEDTYIMDTPGFSSLIVEDIEPENLREYYPEFDCYTDLCRFNGCVHINEPDCAVKEALEKGEISKIRYDNYKQIYEEIKNIRRW